MNPSTEKLREKYIKNPPEGVTPSDIRSMSEDDLLDMDYVQIMCYIYGYPDAGRVFRQTIVV